MPEEEVIVRIADTDIDGNSNVVYGLSKIKGVSYSFANAVISALNMRKSIRIRDLKEEDVKKIEDAIKNPSKYEIPSWLYNRQRDRDTGEDRHITGPDMDIVKKFDIRRLQKIKAYRGIRHSMGLPVRGQRTKSTFRKGRTIGVAKKGKKQR